MKKSEIRVGGEYAAKVAGNLTTVRVDRIEDYDSNYFGKSGTCYHVTNLRTGRKTTFRSAAKFRCEVKPPTIVVRTRPVGCTCRNGQGQEYDPAVATCPVHRDA